MTKKKGKKSKAAKKKPVAAKKKPSSVKRGKEKDTAEVRKELVQLVKDHAQKMTAAVVGEGEKGQVSPVKFLLELAGIFPVPEADVNAPDQREESLAETLLDRLGIPKTPIAADKYAKEDEEIVIFPTKNVESSPDDDEDDEEGSENREGSAVSETKAIPLGDTGVQSDCSI